MRTFTRLAVITIFCSLAVVSLSAQRGATPAAPAPAIVGQWNGSAKSDSGEMNIEVVVEQTAGKYKGAVNTAHGAWTISKVIEKDGTWTVTFDRGGDNGTGTMTGKIDGKTFSGDWDNTPMAVGTFEVVKKGTAN